MNLIEFFEKIAVDVNTLRNANAIRIAGQPGADLSMNTLYGQQFPQPKYMQPGVPQPYSTMTPPQQVNTTFANHGDYLQSRGLLDPANRPAFDQITQQSGNNFNYAGSEMYRKKSPVVGFSADPYDTTRAAVEHIQGPNPALNDLVHRQNAYNLSTPTITSAAHNPVVNDMVASHELSEARSANPKRSQVFKKSYEPGQISQRTLLNSSHRGPQPIEDMILSRTLKPSTQNPQDIRDVKRARGVMKTLRKAEFKDMSNLLRGEGKDRLATILENARDTSTGAAKIKSPELNASINNMIAEHSAYNSKYVQPLLDRAQATGNTQLEALARSKMKPTDAESVMNMISPRINRNMKNILNAHLDMAALEGSTRKGLFDKHFGDGTQLARDGSSIPVTPETFANSPTGMKYHLKPRDIDAPKDMDALRKQLENLNTRQKYYKPSKSSFKDALMKAIKGYGKIKR